MVLPAQASLALTSVEQDFLHNEIDVSGALPDVPEVTSTPSPASKLTPRTQHKQEWLTIQQRAWGRGVVKQRTTTARHGLSVPASNPRSTDTLPSSCITQLQEVERLEQQLAASLANQGQESGSQVVKHVSSLCRQYNRAAMQCVEAGHIKDSLRLLEKAQVLCEEGGVLSKNTGLRNTLMAVTLNNLGVYHQRTGALGQALKDLQQATELEENAMAAAQQAAITLPAAVPVDRPAEDGMDMSGVPDTPASTRLNLCTVLSGLGHHEEALQCVSVAIQQLCAAARVPELDLMTWASNPCATIKPRTGVVRHSTDGGVSDAGRSGDTRLEDGTQGSSKGGMGQRSTGAKLKHLPNAMSSVLAMCLYNRAVQMEHLTLNADAHQHYCAAAGLATKLFGRSSNLSKIFTQSLQAFLCKLRRLGPHVLQRTRSSNTPQPLRSSASDPTPATPTYKHRTTPSPRNTTPGTSGNAPSPYALLPTRPSSSSTTRQWSSDSDGITTVKLKRQEPAHKTGFPVDMYSGQVVESKPRGLRVGTGLLTPGTVPSVNAINEAEIAEPAAVGVKASSGGGAQKQRAMSAGQAPLPRQRMSLACDSRQVSASQAEAVAMMRVASADVVGGWGPPPEKPMLHQVAGGGALLGSGPHVAAMHQAVVFKDLEGLMAARKQHLLTLRVALSPKHAGGQGGLRIGQGE